MSNQNGRQMLGGGGEGAWYTKCEGIKLSRLKNEEVLVSYLPDDEMKHTKTKPTNQPK